MKQLASSSTGKTVHSGFMCVSRLLKFDNFQPVICPSPQWLMGEKRLGLEIDRPIFPPLHKLMILLIEEGLLTVAQSITGHDLRFILSVAR